MESVGAAGDQSDLVVERFGASLVDPEADRREDPVAVLADRFAEPDERGKAAAGQAGQEPIDQHGDVVEGEAVLEDPAGSFLERVAAPCLAAGGLQPLQRRGLVVGQDFLGALSSDQRASLKRLAASWSPSERSSFQYSRRTSSSALFASCTT